jgi:hypothetical protein
MYEQYRRSSTCLGGRRASLPCVSCHNDLDCGPQTDLGARLLDGSVRIRGRGIQPERAATMSQVGRTFFGSAV